MELNQAVNIIKQTLNEAFKSGAVQNIEQAAAICDSWKIIVKELNEATKKPNEQRI
jgi:hypothetical protein